MDLSAGRNWSTASDHGEIKEDKSIYEKNNEEIYLIGKSIVSEKFDNFARSLMIYRRFILFKE